MLPSHCSGVFAIEALVLKSYGARYKKGATCLESGRRGKQGIGLAFYPERDPGIALGQAVGAAAVSADKALPHVAPWKTLLLIDPSTLARTSKHALNGQFLKAADI